MNIKNAIRLKNLHVMECDENDSLYYTMERDELEEFYESCNKEGIKCNDVITVLEKLGYRWEGCLDNVELCFQFLYPPNSD